MSTVVQPEIGGTVNTWGDLDLGPIIHGSYSGPYCVSFGYRSGVECPDMTAIAYVYTSEGFVVGADGLRVDASTNRDVTHTAQKIFLIKHPNFSGIQAWAGASRLFSLGGEPFIFSEESEHLMNNLSQISVNSLADYATHLASEIYQRLLAYNGPVIRNTSLVSKDQVARGLLVGSINGRVESAQIMFPHQNGFLLPPVLREVSEAPTTFCIFSGSALVWSDLQRSNVSPPTSLAEGTHLIRTYIQRCADKRYEYVDCRNIGGHIHIAAITSQRTWWLDPPHDIG
jgi:hypothetical protein